MHSDNKLLNVTESMCIVCVCVCVCARASVRACIARAWVCVRITEQVILTRCCSFLHMFEEHHAITFLSSVDHSLPN
jgi:hypothetical protein